MQARIVALLSLVAIEDVAGRISSRTKSYNRSYLPSVELLRCNDRLNKLFKEFKRYLMERQSTGNASAPHYDQQEDESEVPMRLKSARKLSKPKIIEDEGENKKNRRTSVSDRTSTDDENNQERRPSSSPRNLLPIDDNDQKRKKSNPIHSSTHEPTLLPAIRGTKMDDPSLMTKRLKKLGIHTEKK